jgi:hypothetical protein
VSSTHRNGKVNSAEVEWSSVSRQAALDQLARILDSPQFHSSKRCSEFLRYVIEQAAENHFDCLKERTVGVMVFDRDPAYDTNQDPVVRGTAGEVRKRLAQYYLDPSHDGELRISLPSGSYVPEIHPPPEKLEVVQPSKPRFRLKYLAAAAAVLGIIAAAALFSILFRQTDLDRFWAPVLEPPGKVLVGVGQPRIYNFNAKEQTDLDLWFDNPAKGLQPPPDVPLSALTPMWDRYISLFDAKAFSRISNLFAEKGRKTDLRGGRSISLADLRGKPVVLIGAFNNEWTISLAGELRFYFDVDLRKTEVVRDRQNPRDEKWKIVSAWPRWNIPVDYAIVTRVRNATTEQTVVVSAGITQYGTLAAAEFLTNPEYFAEALKNAPSDWARKNMQVVLSAKVMSGTAGPPTVLAVHFW